MTTHLTFALYRLVLEGHLPAATLAWLGHQHLVRSCESCRLEWEVFTSQGGDDLPLPPLPGASPPEPLPAEDRHVSFRTLEQRLRRQERRREVRRKARRHLAALRSFPPEERAYRITRARTRYRTRAFAELLIEESRQRVETDPREAENLASLVPAVLERIPGATDQPWILELAVRAHAWTANAQRVAGDLARAARTFQSLHVEVDLRDLPPATRAELTRLEASLLIAQRKLPAAARKLEETLMQASFDPLSWEQHAGCMVQLAHLLLQLNRPAEALDHFRDAEHRIDPDDPNPDPARTLLRGRVAALRALGREEEVEAEVEAFRKRYPFPPTDKG